MLSSISAPLGLLLAVLSLGSLPRRSLASDPVGLQDLRLEVGSLGTEGNLWRVSVPVLSRAEIRSLLGPFPAPGSRAEAEDFATLLRIQGSRSAADCERARLDDRISLAAIFGAEGGGGPVGVLTPEELRAARPLWVSVTALAGVHIHLAKSEFKRPRPYDARPEVQPCIERESSTAYPSGHSLLARLAALALVDKYPNKKARLLARSEAYAWHRVVGGVHHPSDLKAAFKLADRLVVELR